LSSFTAVALIEAQLGVMPTPVDVFAGVLEAIQADGIAVAAGAGVGGGSLVYNAITLQPRRELFERVFPRGINYDEMDAVYYPRAKSIIEPAPIPADVLATDFYRSTRINLEQAQRAGFETRLADLAIDWDVVREEIRGEKDPSAIAGQSWYGLNSGAKKSLDRTYLARAEATGHVEILPLHIVVRIEEVRRANLYVVSADHIDAHGAVVARRRFACRHLFLAAGSMGTSALLVKARATGALPHVHEQVGRNWGGNGDFVVTRAGLPSTNPGTGGPAGHFIMEDFSNPFGPTSLIELVTPRHLALLPGLATYVGMAGAPAIGEFSLDGTTGKVNLYWPLGDSRLADFLASSQYMLDTLNAQNTSAGFQPTTLLYAPTLTGHPLGGATVGTVCDLDGRVKGHPGLYVVDGALIPGSAGLVNPSFTIAALAERCLERIVERDIRQTCS
jgi:cholesterol oxidase